MLEATSGASAASRPETIRHAGASSLPECAPVESAARPRLSVVIPVYNERRTIEEVLRRVQAVDIEKEIIVVDDGSEDGGRTPAANGRCQYSRAGQSLLAPAYQETIRLPSKAARLLRHPKLALSAPFAATPE